jgi:hypothetical protein
MSMAVFCGIDWAEEHHDVAVVDTDGRLVAKRRIGEDAAGFGQLLEVLAEAGDSPETPIPVAIETTRSVAWCSASIWPAPVGSGCSRWTGRRSRRIQTGLVSASRSVARELRTAPGTTTIPLDLLSSHRLIPGEMQQPVAGRSNERVTVRAVLAVQCEQDPAFVSVVLLPPSMVGDRLVGVLVGQVIKVVIGNLDRESILFRAHR